jgi:tripartite-type tricarboxylate transporter receptor subunit TctC
MMISRRRFLQLTTSVAGVGSVTRNARGQSYPTRPVHIVVGFPPGQAADISARLLGQWLSERLGQSFIIDNRPGAASTIATEQVVHASPDGYTLLYVVASNYINATLKANLPYNFIRDIEPVGSITRSSLVVEVNPSLPVKSIPELIAYAKANPGKLNMASGGIGNSTHLAGELFKMMTGINMFHVPYRGSAPALSDLISGQVQVIVRPHGLFYRIHQGGPAAGVGSDSSAALRSIARATHRRRFRARLRGKYRGRYRCAKAHAHRDRQQAQYGDQCSPRRS